MPTQVATAIITAIVTGIMLFIINSITPIFLQSQVLVGNFECATFINISNKSNLTATNVKIVVGSNADGIITDGTPFQFHLPSSFPSFTELTDKYNIGDLSPGESRQYLVLSRLGQYSCNERAFSSPLYQVVHDKGVAYLDQFPHTYGPLYLALRHQCLSYIFIVAGIYAILGWLLYLTIRLGKIISTALRGTPPPA